MIATLIYSAMRIITIAVVVMVIIVVVPLVAPFIVAYLPDFADGVSQILRAMWDGMQRLLAGLG